MAACVQATSAEIRDLGADGLIGRGRTLGLPSFAQPRSVPPYPIRGNRGGNTQGTACHRARSAADARTEPRRAFGGIRIRAFICATHRERGTWRSQPGPVVRPTGLIDEIRIQLAP